MISKFERKFGKYAIKNLTLYLIIGYVVGYLVSMFSPEVYELLRFDPYMVLHGQVWRIVTWLIIPPEQFQLISVIIMLAFYYQLGQGLEKTWGTYKYNLYMFSGFLFTIVSAFILYIILGLLYGNGMTEVDQIFGMGIGSCVTTYYVNMSIFLAYAITYPEEKILFYFLIPIRIKWFGIAYGAYIIWEIVNAFRYYSTIQAIIITVLIVASLLNFFLYVILGKNRNRFSPNQIKRRQQYRQSIKRSAPKSYEGGAGHKCAVCGRTELDSPDLTFRYCSKCSGNKEYCQEHLFTHTHN